MAAKTKKIDWQLAPAPESKDHVRIKPEYERFIGGKYFVMANPGNGKVG